MRLLLSILVLAAWLSGQATIGSEIGEQCVNATFGGDQGDGVAEDDTPPDSTNVTVRGKVCVGLGAKSWANSVEAVSPGSPVRCGAEAHEKLALNRPNNERAWLGAGGSMDLGFDDDSIVDAAGPDLWVYERGPDREPVDVWLRTMSGEWVKFGQTAGGKSLIDLATNSETKDRRFNAVRLVDAKARGEERACVTGSYPGAEIDAIGARICAIKFEMNSLSSFAVDIADLNDTMKNQLNVIATLLRDMRQIRISIFGFADADGTDEHNDDLSRRRAESVKSYLATQLAPESLQAKGIEAEGKGEDGKPTDTDAVKTGHRRVDIVVLPAGDHACKEALDLPYIE